MPFPTLSNFSGVQNSTPDELAKFRKELQWLLQSLDSMNVLELTANHISAGTIDVDIGINIESEMGGVYITPDGLEIHNGHFKMYSDNGLTTLIEGGTFYGDNIIITGNAIIGQDVYMDADFTTAQTRRIYPFSSYLTANISFSPGAFFDPSLELNGFTSVDIDNRLYVGGISDFYEAYENGSRLATRQWVIDYISSS